MIDDLQSQGEIFDRIKVSVGLGRQSRDICEMRLSAQEAQLAVLNRLVGLDGCLSVRLQTTATLWLR